jgi:methylmalonyl-CoA mutase N-terminal domain/subunit
VGVNRFQVPEEHQAAALRLDPESERTQVERLRQVRASRSQSIVDQKLAVLEQTARSTGNLMPPILESAACYATVGEISDRLRAAFGEYRET